MDLTKALTSLTNPNRQQIMRALRDPKSHFEPNGYGPDGTDVDPVTVGVCVAQVAKHLEVSPATASQFLSQLKAAGLLTSTRIGKFTYYRRNEAGIQEFIRTLANI